MALSPNDIRWYKTTASGVPSVPLVSGKLHDAVGSIRVGDDTDWTLLALVNDNPTDSLSSASVYLSVESGGVTVAIAKSATGIVAKTAKVAADAGDPTTGTTYSTPTTSGSSIFIGTLAAGQAVGLWVRRVTSGASAKSPETTTLIVTGSYSI